MKTRFIGTYSVIAVLCLSLTGCIASLLRSAFKPTKNQVTLVAASLYNQRSIGGGTSWQGDWVLRRERLQLIDRELFSTQPDVLILQEVMARSSSAYDGDQRILQAGSFADFTWSNSPVHYYDDTDEEEFMSVLARKPVLDDTPQQAAEQFTIAQDGILVLQKLTLRNQAPIAVANLYLPRSAQAQSTAFDTLEERLSEFLKQQQICKERLVLTASVSDSNEENFRKFLNASALTDISNDACESRTCPPPNSSNVFFSSSSTSPQGLAKIALFVPVSSQISEASTILVTPHDNVFFVDKYAITSLWPTAQQGWMARTTFAPCP